MTNLELHIYIQMGLQNVNVFQYAGINREEFDLSINRTIYKILQKAFRPEDIAPTEKADLEFYFDKYQITQDDFKVLKIKNNSSSVSSGDRSVFRSLPSDYFHLTNDRSVVEVVCYENGVAVTKTKEVPNRLMKTENIYTLLEDPFNTTKKDSPISELVADSLYVFHNNKFAINSIVIDYVKQPVKVDSLLNPNQVIEFPEQTAFKIGDFCISYLAKISEQSQQKIVNLESEK